MKSYQKWLFWICEKNFVNVNIYTRKKILKKYLLKNFPNTKDYFLKIGKIPSLPQDHCFGRTKTY